MLCAFRRRVCRISQKALLALVLAVAVFLVAIPAVNITFAASNPAITYTVGTAPYTLSGNTVTPAFSVGNTAYLLQTSISIPGDIDPAELNNPMTAYTETSDAALEVSVQDISLTKISDKTTYERGDTVTDTLTVTNNSNSFTVTMLAVGSKFSIANTAASMDQDEADLSNNTAGCKINILNVVTLYIRQVVLQPNAAVEQPQQSYFSLSSADGALPLTGNSELDTSSPRYAKYLLNPLAGTVYTYKLTDVLPQSYEYAGYYASTNNGNPSGAADIQDTANGDIALTFTPTSPTTAWVTVYIRPDSIWITNYQWSYATNNVGMVSP